MRASSGRIRSGGRGVEVVAAGHHGATVAWLARSTVSAVKPARIGDDLAEHAEPGDAAVGEDGQPEVGEPAAVGDREDVVAVPGQRRPGDDLVPAC